MLLLVITGLSACSDKKEDRIVTDLNEIFDPNHIGETDWNYTEMDEEWLEVSGLYYDNSIGAYRQKAEYVDQYEQKERKPMNPIKTYLILIGVLLIAMECGILYATYLQARKSHRIIWVWITNTLLGGVMCFIVLALAPALKHDKELDIREEPDLLGLVMLSWHIFVFLMIVLACKMLITITAEPHVLEEFIKPLL